MSCKPNAQWRHLRLILLCAAFLLAGCGMQVRERQSDAAQQLLLAAGSSVGQSIDTHHAGLTAISIFVAADPDPDGAIELTIRSRTVDGLRSGPVLATATQTTGGRSQAGYIRFDFAPLARAESAALYVALTRTRGAPIAIGAGDAARVLDGSAYVGDKPVEAQLSFELAYDNAALLTGALGAAASWLPGVVALLALLLIPGSALLRVLWPESRQLSWFEQLGLWAGAGMAIYPVFLVWTNLLGLNLAIGHYLLVIAAGIGVHLVDIARRRRATPDLPPLASPAHARRPKRFDVLALCVVGALLISRYLPVASQGMPLWGDSLHHATIAQLVVDNGGLFDSWQPYADAQTFTYHPGLHVLIAGVMHLTVMSAATATLFTGQMLNVLAVLALAPLAQRLSGQRWAGLIAVALAGFITAMPMSYTNWGRYTQLAGQMILPAALCATWALTESRGNKRPLRLIALTAVLIAGLALTHYRVIIFWMLATAAIVLVARGPGLLKKQWPAARHAVVALAAAGVTAGVLLSPWAARVYQSELARSFTQKLATPATAVATSTQSYNEAGSDILQYMPAALWLAAGAAALAGIARRSAGTLMPAVWWIVLWIATNPGRVGLPGTGIISNFAINISAYLPVALLLGDGLGWLAGWLATRWRAGSWGVSALIGAAAIYGLMTRPGDVQIAPHVLATNADTRAAAWAGHHLSRDARIAINGFVPGGNGYVAGTDGGWWLRPLTGLHTSIPPMQSQAEVAPEPDYLANVRAIADLTSHQSEDPGLLQALKAAGYTHIYVGQLQGRSNNPFGSLTVAALDGRAGLRAVYREDRVGIYVIE